MNFAHRLPFHYGWLVIATGCLGLFACLGMARFAFGMLLPSMGVSLELNYDEMGYIGTANFAGYFTAVLFIGPLVGKFGSRKVASVGLLLISFTMISMGYCDSFVEFLILYTLTGLGSGAVNVPITGLAMNWFGRTKRGKAAGFLSVGSGLAIMLTGWLIPIVNQYEGADGWRISWIILGCLSLLIAALAYTFLRNTPADLGLQPVADTVSVEKNKHQPPSAEPVKKQPFWRITTHLGLIYFGFGFTYVIYATFIVTTLINERGFTESTAGQFWFWVGFFSLFSGPLFGTLSDRFGRKAGLVTVFTLQTCAYALVGVNLPELFLYVSVFLFGITAWSIPTIIAASVGDFMGPQRAVAGLSVVTIFFGVGQIAGPAIVGAMAEQSSTFSGGYLMAAGVTISASILAMALRKN
jgi:MFS family permease